MAIKPHLNERELLARIAVGDQRAFSEIFNWYYQPLGQAINKLTESLPLTQEIVQDTFVKIWQRREALQGVESFSNYLFIICRNHAFKTLKSLASQRKLQPMVEQHMQWENELEGMDNPSEYYREMIKEAVEKLPIQQRKIYNLSRHDQMKYEEIAEKLGISPETVKTQVYNAVKFIRKDLNANISPSIIVILTSVLNINP